VWSEGAVPYAMNAPLTRQPRRPKGAPCAQPQDPARLVQMLAKNGEFDIMVGAGTLEPYPLPPDTKDYRQFNSIYYFKKDGTALPRYDKMVPLPFGEYLPFANWFPVIRGWIQGPGNFQAGTEARVFHGSGAVIGPPICYEAILSSVCRKYPSPDLLVNITNDGWFGDTAAPHQHAMLAAVRSVEMGIPVYRAAYSGISMLIEPHGRIVGEAAPFEDAARVIIVRMKTIPTVYRRLSDSGLHDWFVWLCALFLVFGLGVGPWIQKRRPAHTS
jgi:apolipoprotein N-acyltransferase